MEQDSEKFLRHQRSEEVADIIERMPTQLGARVLLIVAFIICTALVFGFCIRYPDIISGQLTVNGATPPVRLVSQASGILRLPSSRSQGRVEKGSIVGFIETPASIDTLMLINGLLAGYNPANDEESIALLGVLPRKANLGELTLKYYGFISALGQLENFMRDQPYQKQIGSLRQLEERQVAAAANVQMRLGVGREQVSVGQKQLGRDSTLFSQKVAAEAEVDRSRINLLGAQSALQSVEGSLIDAQTNAQQTAARIREVEIQLFEKKKELQVAVLAAFHGLQSDISAWESRYLLRAPFSGQLVGLKFWSDGQFVEAATPIFTIVPDNDKPSGQVLVPALGAGKIKVGQEVIIRLDNYPVREYGSIRGTVKSKSVTSGTQKTSNGEVDTYLVTVDFDNGLVTNYGQALEFIQDSKGVADIVTNDRRLIERFFDNIRYVSKK